MDTQGSLSHIAAIFKFGDASGPRGKKWPKVNRRLKIVNYFTCMRHFSCRWYRSPEVDLNWYPRISNPYCRDIQIQRCERTQGEKMTQSKSPIKNSELFYMYHSCCVWTRVLWQVARQRSDGDQLVAAGLGQLVMGVTFIPLFYGRAPLVATERAVLALFCTPTSWGR